MSPIRVKKRKMKKVSQLIKKYKNFLIFSSLKVLIIFLGLVINVLVIRKLTVNDFGIFSVALMFVGLVRTFGFSWSSSSIIYIGGKEKAETGNINKTFWSRNIIVGASLVLITALFVIFRQQINSYIESDVAILILIWLYVSVAEDYLSYYFLAVKRQLLSGMLSVTAKIVYLILILIFKFDIKTLIIINIVSHATVLLYVFGFNKKDVGKFDFDKHLFKEVLNFSLWQLFGFSGLYLINFGDTVVIKHFMTTEDVGIYNVAYRLFEVIANLAFVISSYFAGNVARYFTENDSAKIKQFFYRDRFLIVGLTTFVHVIIIVFSEFFIVTLYGQEYVAAVPIFNVLMIGSVFRFFGVFYMLYLNTTGRYKSQQFLNILRAILNVILDIILIQVFGLIGPAIATTVAIILTFAISLLLL